MNRAPACPLWRTEGSKTIAIAILATVVINGCAPRSQEVPENTLAQRLRPRCGSPSSEDFFFRAGTFAARDTNYDGASTRRKYSAYLSAMSEPSLSCGEMPEEAYRLLWVPIFDPQRLAISVSRTGHVSSLVANVISSAANDVSFTVGNRIEKVVTNDQWLMLTLAIHEINLWIMPERRVGIPRERIGLDGNTWVLEGRRGGGRYHTHGPSGQPYPSGTLVRTALPTDLDNADSQPGHVLRDDKATTFDRFPRHVSRGRLRADKCDAAGTIALPIPRCAVDQ